MVKETVLDLGLACPQFSPMSSRLASVLSDWTFWPLNTGAATIPLLPSNLAKGPGFGAARVVQIWEDGILKYFVQKTATTCFVPPSFVWVAWQGVQQEATPELDDINDFVYYFDRTWNDDQFRLQQWNYYNYDGPTTITLKASTPGWSELWANPHPNIFEIVDVITKEQATTEMNLEQFAAGATQPPLKEAVYLTRWEDLLNPSRMVKVVLQSI